MKVAVRSITEQLNSVKRMRGIGWCLGKSHHMLPEVARKTNSSSINTFRLRQNGHHFADDMFKFILLYKVIMLQLKFDWFIFPKGPIDNPSTLFQVMAWHRTCRIYASPGLSELMMESKVGCTRKMSTHQYTEYGYPKGEKHSWIQNWILRSIQE